MAKKRKINLRKDEQAGKEKLEVEAAKESSQSSNSDVSHADNASRDGVNPKAKEESKIHEGEPAREASSMEDGSTASQERNFSADNSTAKSPDAEPEISMDFEDPDYDPLLAKKALRDKKKPSIWNDLYLLLSSMRFAVALLVVVCFASVIGTFLPQSKSTADMVFNYGDFWAGIFLLLGLNDIYSSVWFITIMCFLIVSTAFCLVRHVPAYLKEMAAWRLKVTEKSLSRMRMTKKWDSPLPDDVAIRYLENSGFDFKQEKRDDGSYLIAAKKGVMNRWGYILAHGALIVICLGGLIDSTVLLKLGVETGKIVPDDKSIYIDEFAPESVLPASMPSFRGDVTLNEGQTTDATFLNMGDGKMLIQKLPFYVELKKFDLDYYPNGMPSNYRSSLLVTDKKTGKAKEVQIEVNHPFTMDGVTIYQSSFGDGGSNLVFDLWYLKLPNAEPQEMKAISMSREVPFTVGTDDTYKLTFDELKTLNVVPTSENEDAKTFKKRLEKLSKSTGDMSGVTNIGSSIQYSIKDPNGELWQYVSYMDPIEREGALHLNFGIKKPDEPSFKWILMPLANRSPMLFMKSRELLMDPQARAKAAEAATRGMDEGKRKEKYAQIVKLVMDIYAERGLGGIEKLISNYPDSLNDPQKTAFMFFDILRSGAQAITEMAAKELKMEGDPWGGDIKAKNKFLSDELDAYSGLLEYPSPILLHLKDWEVRYASGLQLSKSPGKWLVYLGSLLLTLGIFVMFYVRERRLWLLVDKSGTRMSMAANAGNNKRFFEDEWKTRLEDMDVLVSEKGGKDSGDLPGN